MHKLLKFSATWCGPCKTFAPIVKEVASNLNISVEEIDVDKNSDLVNKYNVKSVPTIVLLNNDVEVARQIGLVPKTKFSDWIKSNKYDKNKKSMDSDI